MSLDRDFVLNALLRHNFLPAQRESREELPPVFSSASFAPDDARKVAAGKTRKGGGYDAVDYRLTRFNGVYRSCSIPHPVGYAKLALCIHEHWDKLDYITKSENSLIRPREHEDGRILIMDYENSSMKTRRHLGLSYGKRFKVHTDISNCFPTIYSHAIPWATVGFAHAKSHKSRAHENEWFNQLDKSLRAIKRDETQGVAIGPATSNIVSEAILVRVDELLRPRFTFFRFIDDYTAYCDTEEQAQEFIRELSGELGKFKLLLNLKKTEVLPLPQPLSPDWITELSLRIPKTDEINGYDAVNFINFAVSMAKQSPDGSVMKYAFRSLTGKKLDLGAKSKVLEYALTISFHQPTLLPLLTSLLTDAPDKKPFQYGEQLKSLATESAKHRRSDGMAWTLHYLNRHEVAIEDGLAEMVIQTRDCVAMLMLYLSGNATHQQKVVDFANSLDVGDTYGPDEYWLLLYQLFVDGKIPNLYPEEDGFDILKSENVSFIQNDVPAF